MRRLRAVPAWAAGTAGTGATEAAVEDGAAVFHPRDGVGMNLFASKLAAHGLTLRRGALQTLQINVGRKCNQACAHCHVDAAPWRTEMMSAPVARRVQEWIRAHRPATVDLTGGAP